MHRVACSHDQACSHDPACSNGLSSSPSQPKTISTIRTELGAFSPYFSITLTFPNSNLVLGVYHPSIAQGGTFFPSTSNPNGEQHLSRQVIELTSALAQ
ncbi:hypothetical protein ACFX12_023049 [Malus domestica]